MSGVRIKAGFCFELLAKTPAVCAVCRLKKHSNNLAPAEQPVTGRIYDAFS